mgnify:CR=1 FL=1
MIHFFLIFKFDLMRRYGHKLWLYGATGRFFLVTLLKRVGPIVYSRLSRGIFLAYFIIIFWT